MSSPEERGLPVGATQPTGQQGPSASDGVMLAGRQKQGDKNYRTAHHFRRDPDDACSLQGLGYYSKGVQLTKGMAGTPR